MRSGVHSAHYSGVICRDELFPRVGRELGGRGEVLRRTDGGEVAFVTLVWFESLDVVRGFAGEDYEKPVISERAAQLLSRCDDRALHYDA